MIKKKPIVNIPKDKWIKATEDSSLSPGKRIRLCWDISEEAAQIIKKDKTGKAESEIRLVIPLLCKTIGPDGKPKTRFNPNEISQFLRLCNFSEAELSKLAKDADRVPIETTSDQLQKTGCKSRMTLSHAILLAAETDGKLRRKLLHKAIGNHWPYSRLREELKAARKESISQQGESTGNKPVRHRQTVNSITKAVDGLQDLLAELSEDSFAQTITKSDRRDRADTLKKLKGLAEKLDEIRKQIPAAKKAANVAAKNLENFIGKE